MSRLSKANEEGWREIFAPAKVNLMLSVHGKRADGFHELTSVVAPLAFGDVLRLRPAANGSNRLRCGHAAVPEDRSNLVLRAAELFAEETGFREPFEFVLEKNVPVGAGLGGGSSDGTACLVALNEWFEQPLSNDRLRELAGGLGSDCALFVDPCICLITGRGEVVTPDLELSRSLSGRRLVLFRPPFGVNTAWAYKRMASVGLSYEPREDAERRLNDFSKSGDLADLLFNCFESVVNSKFVAIASILAVLRDEGLPCIMSGSGSSCFCLLDGSLDAFEIESKCRQALGESMFCVETFLL